MGLWKCFFIFSVRSRPVRWPRLLSLDFGFQETAKLQLIITCCNDRFFTFEVQIYEFRYFSLT